jgi:hypothetical protein
MFVIKNPTTNVAAAIGCLMNKVISREGAKAQMNLMNRTFSLRLGAFA